MKKLLILLSLLPSLCFGGVIQLPDNKIDTTEEVGAINQNFQMLHSGKLDLKPGSVIPKLGSAYDLGASAIPWRDIYSDTLTASTATLGAISVSTAACVGGVFSVDSPTISVDCANNQVSIGTTTTNRPFSIYTPLATPMEMTIGYAGDTVTTGRIGGISNVLTWEVPGSAAIGDWLGLGHANFRSSDGNTDQYVEFGAQLLNNSTGTETGGFVMELRRPGKSLDDSAVVHFGMPRTGDGVSLRLGPSELLTSTYTAIRGGMYLLSDAASRGIMSAGSEWTSNISTFVFRGADLTGASAIGMGTVGSGVISFYTDNSISSTSFFNATERMRIDSFGDVTIYSTTTITGNVAISSGLTVGQNVAISSGLTVTHNALFTSSVTAGALQLNTQAGRLFIDTDRNTYITGSGSNDRISMYLNGLEYVKLNVAGFTAPQDNTISLGGSGERWTEVWAAIGTINTSNTRNKKDIIDLETTTNIVPRGIKFKWKEETGLPSDRDYIGFEADDLPLEAHPKKLDGTYDMDNVYTNSVIGLLCAEVRKLRAEVDALKAKAAKP